MADKTVFEHAPGFEQRESGASLRLERYESYYEQLFAEVLEDGVITPEERIKLDRMAEQLGLDRERVGRLESALQAAFEARHHVRVREIEPGFAADDEPRASLTPFEPDARTRALERKIAYLESRIAELERDLEHARSQVAIEVDFSDLEPKTAARVEDADDLARRLRHDPRDQESLHALFRALGDEPDRKWCVGQVLVYLGAATPEEHALFRAHDDGAALIKPERSVDQETWWRLLVHPEEEPLTGEIFGIIAPAVLLAHVSALRHAKKLVALDAEKRQDAATSTLSAIRSMTWAGAIFGMAPPTLYADPEFAGLVEMVPNVPPATRLGKLALANRSPDELAFVAGQHLSWYRQEHFLRLLVPSVQDLEDLFLAALVLGKPDLPLASGVKERVSSLAKAIEPLLEPAQLDRLRSCFLRFVEEGGRTNLQRWAVAADRTAARAGLLLANNLPAAEQILKLERGGDARATMDDLLAFATSDRYSKLRQHIGVAVPR